MRSLKRFAVRMNLSFRTAMLITPLLGLSYALAVTSYQRLELRDDNKERGIRVVAHFGT
jgi:hypothetical protein